MCPLDRKNLNFVDTGTKLKKLRGSLTQKCFAEKLGVALRTYVRYESGERKVPDGLLKLAEILSQPYLIKDMYKDMPLIRDESDPFAQAVSALRDIFNAHSPTIQSAILANIIAFKLTADVIKERDDLKKEMERLKSRIERLEAIVKKHIPQEGVAEDNQFWQEMKAALGL